ncbi:MULTISPECIES: glutamate-cysteine ligase family protein [unclassified Enterococcus]|uniref:glutamate-cysteine ligase family protein n=1 Tax=unclassified Enterococcus TaxID=2608891 RepID=UPI0015524455|nr:MULTISPECIES: glutamate-cysteine ligase family protein [unclassified Enterococcus]MBS7576679.1 gamma-glutamylcysteine synthetase [Enterococcus sp. MMGLQ5-2]MBS7583834.1 gamma-glutamylcysteine synthetase [Enterococcus sp. MMGLQ5-1]NPD11695.1 gamma-glutamylcysteine synthetase [Enterococcus sp. MMGLQ5-1]NPD36516.1 gamma-glutamylcysteine synthetase [Enterococcus sp. MMGLQ5-2]
MIDQIGKVLLYNRYISNLPKEQKSLIGIELEYPIVNLANEAVDINFVRQLLVELVAKHQFIIIKRDDDGYPIEIQAEKAKDIIVFEVSYNNLEFALSPVLDLHQADQRMRQYLKWIQAYLNQKNHQLTGMGVNPKWHLNDAQPVKSARYQMLTAYLASYSQYDDVPAHFFHQYPQYGSFISGSQVQLDVTAANLLQVLNVFNQIEPIKAWLFGNSYFWGEHWQTTVARDIFWENSMHGIFPNNVGVFPKWFESIDEYLDYLAESVIFQVTRNKQTYYFPPITVQAYFGYDEIIGTGLRGDSIVITPDIEDIKNHRSYNYQDLTARGTVEFRSCCQQPLNERMTVAAFHLGIFNQLPEVTTLLKNQPLVQQADLSIEKARRHFSTTKLSDETDLSIAKLTGLILDIAKEGLDKRGLDEAVYLEPLIKRVALLENPAKQALKRLSDGTKMNEIIEDYGRI